jgi:hypothetical protein
MVKPYSSYFLLSVFVGTSISVMADKSVRFYPSSPRPFTELKRVRDQHADFPSEESRRGTMAVQSSQGLPHPPSFTPITEIKMLPVCFEFLRKLT